MARLSRLLVFLIPALGGGLPLLVYWTGHGGLGAASFPDQRTMTAGEQMAQVAAGLYIKPVYMLISLALIVALWDQTRPGARALFLGLSAFLVGESFCALNFLVYKHTSLISEYIHSYGMVIALACVIYAALGILDGRLLHISARQRAAARRTTLTTVALGAVLCLLPLSASYAPRSYLTDPFGFPYSYARFDLYQWYEARALPLVALALFLTAFIGLRAPSGEPLPLAAKMLFSAGAGALGFSLFRLTLAGLFAQDLVWFEFWEELSELLFTSGIAFVLWRFRDILLQRKPMLALLWRN